MVTKGLCCFLTRILCINSKIQTITIETTVVVVVAVVAAVIVGVVVAVVVASCCS